MPTIKQLPSASEVNAEDEIPLSQGGLTKSATVGALLDGMQPAVIAPSGSLLGRVSIGPGGPEPVSVGPGLGFSSGALVANGADHAAFPVQQTSPADRRGDPQQRRQSQPHVAVSSA